MTGQRDLDQFVRRHIRSVWTLELLLLLRRDPQRCWRSSELIQELRASQTVVDNSLQKLAASALVVPDDGGWRYGPAGAVLAAMCETLATAYAERPVAIISMISAPDPVQSLADAFKFRRDTA